MTHTLYISGPITNDLEYWQKFFDCQQYAIEHTLYDEIINPAITNIIFLYNQGIDNPDYTDYMRASFYHMTKDSNTDICFLPDYIGSLECKNESWLGKILDYRKMYFDPSMPVINGLPKEMMR